MSRIYTQYGSPVPMQGHRQYIGTSMARQAYKARDLRGHRQRIDTGAYFSIDNQATLIPQVVGARAVIFAEQHPDHVRDLYASCERAPFGWEDRA